MYSVKLFKISTFCPHLWDVASAELATSPISSWKMQEKRNSVNKERTVTQPVNLIHCPLNRLKYFAGVVIYTLIFGFAFSSKASQYNCEKNVHFINISSLSHIPSPEPVLTIELFDSCLCNAAGSFSWSCKFSSMDYRIIIWNSILVPVLIYFTYLV